MIAAGLTLMAFFALAAAMPRHAPALLGRWQGRVPTGLLRMGGWAQLVLAGMLSALGGGIALVTWVGLLPATAALVLLGLSYDPRLARAGGLAGALLLLAGIAG